MAEINTGGPTLPSSDRGYVDFGAIIAGTVVAVGASLVFGAFAAALGLGSFSFDDNGGISTFVLILTALFAVISLVVVYLLGGYIAGRLRRRVEVANSDEVRVRDGLHGLVVWGLGAILSALMVSGAVTGAVKTVGAVAGTAVEATGSAVGGALQGAGQLAGGVVSGVGGAIGGVAQGAGQAVAPTLQDALPSGLSSNPLDYVSDSLLRPANTVPGPTTGEPGNAKEEISQILINLVRTGEISDEDKAYLKQVVAAQTGLSTSEVDKRVDEAQARAIAIRDAAQKKVDEAKAQIEQLKADAAKAADDAKEKAAQAAEHARIAGILSAFLLAASTIIAAAAAYIGAVRGGEHRDDGRIWGGLSHRRR
ncbi:hypothetical protein [Paracoccus aminophilus]|uniref:Uncharacterized protein n=1 Tax=Paracoccus aminophilus JCM 7686 TaxID=1367847 RepID=S5Y0G4_PARAH|nr:hypothetical protein [Paracoccus aminophilus]AGT11017.1 hypothetical protein JCM7686_pAMI4p329 [Paracoccus aminophilus JCM 7686]